MSEQQKRPAHEVILRKLRELVQVDRQGGHYMDFLRDLAKIAAWNEVLSEMVIPEKVKESLLGELEQLAHLWDEKIGSPELPNMIRDLHCDLSQG